tara:strand:+ start:109 stop:2055 length:1947 start_codon:yes stop_codon:yes gene_type:complete
MNREVQDSEIQKRVELVRLKARQVGNMEPENPGLISVAAQEQLSKLIPAREQATLAAIEVDRLPPPVDPTAYSDNLAGMLSTLNGELAKENDFVLPDNSALETEIAVEKRNELVDDFGLDAEGADRGLGPAAEQPIMANRVRLTLVDRVIQQESDGDPLAVNPYSKAAGLMQIMQATAADPGFGVTPLAWEDRFDPELNRAFGAEYLAALMERYDGDEEAALIAYNAGYTRADKWLAAGRDYEPFRGYTDEDGDYVRGWADESEPYAAAIMGNQTLAPARVAVYGENPYNVLDVELNLDFLAGAEATIDGNELASAGVNIPGLTQSDSVHRFTFSRAADPLEGIDTSYLPTEAATTPTETFYEAPVSDSEDVHPGSYKSVGEFVIDLKSHWPALRGLMVDGAAWAAGPEGTETTEGAVHPGSYETVGEFVSDLTNRWPEWREELVRLADIAAGPGETEPNADRPAYPGSFENMAEFGAELKARWPELRASLLDLASAAAGRDLTEEVTGEAAALAAGDASLERANWTPTYIADVLTHHAAAQGIKDMAYLPEVQLALKNMNSDVLLAWMDATRGNDDLHKEQAESALLAAGFFPRTALGEKLPSDRFFNVFAYARIDGGRASDQQRADAGEGPLRQILAASRRMVFNR